MSTMNLKLSEMGDLYKLLDVEDTATIEQIKKAYRKRALELHPDKNLGNKEEAEKKFIELGKAFEILTDKSAKAAYDALVKQKKEKAKRDEQLDEKRRKLKESLEKREQEAKDKFKVQTDHMKKNKEEELFQREIDRLRKEGSRLLEEEMNFINEQIRLEKQKVNQEKSESKNNSSSSQQKKTSARIKINWKGILCHDSSLDVELLLKTIFKSYGELDVLVVGKKNSAIVEYKHLNDSIKCYNDANDLNKKYSINLTWLGPDINQTQTESQKQPKNDSETPKCVKEDLFEFSSSNFDEMEMTILKKLKG